MCYVSPATSQYKIIKIKLKMIPKEKYKLKMIPKEQKYLKMISKEQKYKNTKTLKHIEQNYQKNKNIKIIPKE